MSQENVERVRRVADAYNRRDVEARREEIGREIPGSPGV
jgi:hypothetical protein